MELYLVENLIERQNVCKVCQDDSFKELVDDEIGDGELEAKVLTLDEF